MQPQTVKRLIGSFKHATEGIMDAFRSQKHMRVHFFIIILVAILTRLYRLEVTEVAILILCIALVIITELFNTALEGTINLLIQTYHPVAKFAKDVAAGAVLVASVNAAVIGFCIFLNPPNLRKAFGWEGSPPAGEGTIHVAAIGLVLVMVLIVISKVWHRPGSVLRGGPLSGHTALASALSACIFFIASTANHPYTVHLTLFSLVLVGLVAHSRVQGGLHTLKGVIYGALLGVLTMGVVFGLLR